VHAVAAEVASCPVVELGGACVRVPSKDLSITQWYPPPVPPSWPSGGRRSLAPSIP